MDQRGKLVLNEIAISLDECMKAKDLTSGRRVHAIILDRGIDCLATFGSHLIRMFASCGSLLDANRVFVTIVKPNFYAWEAIITAHAMFEETGKAIELCCQMQQDGLIPNHSIFLCIMKACTRKGLYSLGNLVHQQIIKSGLHVDVSVGSTLIDMYAKCGSIREAQKVFNALPDRNVVSWNVIISAYANNGKGVSSLKLFKGMRQEGIKPVKVTFLCVLKACTMLGAIGLGNLIHDEIVTSGFESDNAVGNTLIDMYAKCRCLHEARTVFDKLPRQDVVSWNAMISGYAQYGNGASALELFNSMQKKGTKPDCITFSCIFKACSSTTDLGHGKRIHKQLIRSGLEIDVVIGSTLVDMYVKCGSLEEARKVFDELPDRNTVPWCTMIAAYAQHEQYFSAFDLFEKMQEEGRKPDSVTFSCVLKACANMGAFCQGKVIHNQIRRLGLETDSTVGNALMDMYMKCGSLNEAQQVFDELPNRDIVSWNSIIVGNAQTGNGLIALELVGKMQEEGIKPDKVTFLGTLRACSAVRAIGHGKKLHEQIIRSGLELDVVIGSTLVDMYAKWGNLDEAIKVFERLLNQDVVSYGAMIAGYVQHGHNFPALYLFWKMEHKAIKPDNVTYACILKACGGMQALEVGCLVHDQILRSESDKDVVIGNALIDMYAKCWSVVEAHKIFDVLPGKNVVSWNALMTGYVQYDDSLVALDLFEKMQQEDVKPDKISFLCNLKACGNIGAIDYGRLSHEQIIRNGFESDLVIGNTIVDMYAKCGNLEEASKAFDELSNQDVVSWSALISGYAQAGNFRLAQQHLHNMQQQGVKPVRKTFTSILVACSHSGQVGEGHRYFKSMIENYGIKPGIEHFNCMVDLLGRAGCLNDAGGILHTMPVSPNITGWISLLTSCRTFGNLELGKQCFDQVMELDPTNSSAYMLMSKLYADAHMWEDVHKLHSGRKFISACKKLGRAWVDVDNKLTEFVVGDKTNHHVEKLHSKLKTSIKLIKEKGYVSHLGSLETVSDEDEPVLVGDCEKEAKVVGLLSTHNGTAVHILKKFQVCNDCDTAANFISDIERHVSTERDTHCAFWSRKVCFHYDNYSVICG